MFNHDSKNAILTQFRPRWTSSMTNRYARYEEVFKKDGQRFYDAAQVRLLLHKLSGPVHEEFVNFPSIPLTSSWWDDFQAQEAHRSTEFRFSRLVLVLSILQRRSWRFHFICGNGKQALIGIPTLIVDFKRLILGLRLISTLKVDYTATATEEMVTKCSSSDTRLKIWNWLHPRLLFRLDDCILHLLGLDLPM